ncbi:MAG: enoyl-CoA hydratase-related protein [Rubrivivax sp.]
MENDYIDVRRRDHALWLTLNRPDALNALTPGMVATISTAVSAAQSDEATRSIVLAGSGRAFCSGADLTTLPASKPGAGDSQADAFLAEANQMMALIQTSAKPVIAAVNGLALAGGFELVLCADIVFAARSARFGDAHANFGLLPGGGGTARLPRAIGRSWAKYMMFTAELFDAEALATQGLVNEVVDDGALEQAVVQLTERIASKSPLGLARMKALIDAGMEVSLDEALAAERRANVEHASSADLREGLLAFAEKRRPKFTGR